MFDAPERVDEIRHCRAGTDATIMPSSTNSMAFAPAGACFVITIPGREGFHCAAVTASPIPRAATDQGEISPSTSPRSRIAAR